MNLARSLLAAALILLLTAIPATAESVNEGWNAGDVGGWQPLTIENTIEVVDAGGVGGGGFLRTYQTATSYGISGAIQRFAPYIGDYSARGYIVVRCDLQFFAGTFTDAYLRIRYLDASHNGWILPLTTDFSTGAWRNATFEFDPTWSDGQAVAAGWVQEATSASFQETMANVFTAEVRILGDGALEVGIDNFQLDDDLVGTEAVNWGQVKALFR